MAINPPISLEGLPLSVDGEYFVLKRKDIEVEFKVPEYGKQTGKGFVINQFSFTSQQLEWCLQITIFKKKSSSHLIFLSSIFIKNLSNNLFLDPTICKAWQDLYINIYLEIQGSNYGLSLEDVQLFFRILVLGNIRKNQGRDQNFAQNVKVGAYGQNNAFYDASDPTTMFIEQPGTGFNDVNQINQAVQSNSFYGNGGMYDEAMKFQNMQNQQIQNDQMQNQGFQQQPMQNQGFQQQPMQNQGFQQQPMQNQGFQQQYTQNQNFQNQNYQYQNPQFQGNPQMIGSNNQTQGYQDNQFNQMNQQNYQQQMPQMQAQEIPMQNQPQMQPLNMQQQQQQMPNPNMNVGYYYGWWGPQLQRNY